MSNRIHVALALLLAACSPSTFNGLDAAGCACERDAGAWRRPGGTGGGGSGPPPGLVLESIDVTPHNPTVAGSQQFVATGSYSSGAKSAVLTSIVQWLSATPGNIAIDENGLATGVAGGSSVITAAYGPIVSPGQTATISSLVRTSSISLSNQVLNGAFQNATFEIPDYVPADVTSVRLRVRNFNRNGAGFPTVADVTGVKIALYACDDSGHATGSAIQSWTNQTLPSDQSYWSSGFVTMSRNVTTGRVCTLITVNAGAVISEDIYPHWGRALGGTAQVTPLPGGFSDSAGPMPYDMQLDYVSGALPVVVIGDSLAVAKTINRELGWAYQLGVQYGYAVDSSGVTGGTINQWNTIPTWYAPQVYQSAHVFVEATVNGLPTAETLGDFQDRVRATCLRVKQAGALRCYVVTPTGVIWAASESKRQTYLTWLRAPNPSPPRTNIDDVLDTDAVVRDGSNPAILAPGFDSGDGHYTGSAHAAIVPVAHAMIVAHQALDPSLVLLLGLARLMRRRKNAANDNARPLRRAA